MIEIVTRQSYFLLVIVFTYNNVKKANLASIAGTLLFVVHKVDSVILMHNYPFKLDITAVRIVLLLSTLFADLFFLRFFFQIVIVVDEKQELFNIKGEQTYRLIFNYFNYDS